MARIGSAEYVGSWPTGSPEWHAARADGLGGSEIAAALGLSPFESPFSLHYRKTGAIGPVEETPEMEWGKRLEPVIVAKFLDEHPEYSDAGTATYRHADRPWQITNPDRLLAGHRFDDPHTLLETKFSMYGDGWGETGTDDIPVHVRIQTLWYCDIFGFDRAHVAVLVGGCDFREYVVTYDAAEVELLRGAAVKFLDDVANRRRPEIDSSTHTYQALRELHPDIDPRKVELTDGTARAYLQARADLTVAKDTEQLARSLVADEMGTAQAAWWQGQKLATRQAKGDGPAFVKAARNLPTPAPQETAAA
jgi:putative phage-type endonuclease